MFSTVWDNATSGSNWWLFAIVVSAIIMIALGYVSYYVKPDMRNPEEGKGKITSRFTMLGRIPIALGFIVYVLFWSETTMSIQGWLDHSPNLAPGPIAQYLLHWELISLFIGVSSGILLFLLERIAARIRFRELSSWGKSHRRSYAREMRRLEREAGGEE